VLSRAYLSDQWATFGEQLASYTAVAEQRERLVPLLRERDCTLPLHIEFRVRLDCTEQSNWEAEISRLRQLLAPRRRCTRCRDAPALAAVESVVLDGHYRHFNISIWLRTGGCQVKEPQ